MGRLFEAIHEAGSMNHTRYWLVMDYVRLHFKGRMSALEIGSDDGAFALGFAMIGYDVTTVDNVRTPFMAHLYTHYAQNFKVFYGATIAPDRARAYDIVHLGEVIEHVKDPTEVLSRACGLCRGKIIVSVPNFKAGGHLRVYETAADFCDFIRPFVDVETFEPIESHKKPGKYQWLAMGEPK